MRIPPRRLTAASRQASDQHEVAAWAHAVLITAEPGNSIIGAVMRLEAGSGWPAETSGVGVGSNLPRSSGFAHSSRGNVLPTRAFDGRRPGVARRGRLTSGNERDGMSAATEATEILVPAKPRMVTRKPRQLFWQRFKEDRAAVAAAVVIVLLILIAIGGGPLAQAITGHAEQRGRTRRRWRTPFGLPKGPNAQFWFGADGDGPRPVRAHDVRRAHLAHRRRRRLGDRRR